MSETENSLIDPFSFFQLLLFTSIFSRIYYVFLEFYRALWNFVNFHSINS